jgi:hypothetical protein
MEPKTVIGGDPATENVLVTDQAFWHSSVDIVGRNGDFRSTEPIRVFEGLLSRKGATT